MKIIFQKLMIFVIGVGLTGYAFGDIAPLYFLIGSVIQLIQMISIECVETYEGQ